MNQSRDGEERLRELIGVDLIDAKLRRLARVDALLRLAAAHDRNETREAAHRREWVVVDPGSRSRRSSGMARLDGRPG